jgi:dipeptidase E
MLEMNNMILASSSSVHGSGYLVYLQKALKELFSGCKQVLFIPYARPGGISYDAYTSEVVKGLQFLNAEVRGLHDYTNPTKALEDAEAVFVGGGNTFVLVDALYKNGLFPVLKSKIEVGMPYLGTSAGSNICGVTMQTTNDMPIAKPQSFETLECLPFNINAHFLPADPNSTHQGETRETRIKEYHVFHDTPVVGLQEGSWLRLKNKEIVLRGDLPAYIYESKSSLVQWDPGTAYQSKSSI